ncbi:orotidine-5'-phosphate decarboxylase [Ichthyobacterium seriolicida]|uniref:Orotidine-5'-phosphate decarboxylase n=1 Tax=Ichthyobacterium seriolicida TaxID=242600 RepID=A0A1J1E5T4_9FLAO|nr:orotidine-5'-phosphate decarboxylase [Ichthyobacterium seriolicida]BAV94678.1 ctidine 5'-phosphate decarboxylase [Ichthyobacterium seriolicida]
MTPKLLVEQIKKKKSFLCVGLDTDLSKIPPHLLELDDPIFAFNKQIIDSTHEFAVAYKPNIAFYEAEGISGLESLKKTMDYLNTHYPEVFTIADAKRGDIGNTSKMYAKTFFEYFNFDAITVSPYMGEDSVSPFLSYRDKTTIILVLTSNCGAYDFQTKILDNSQELYKRVLETAKKWDVHGNMMFVVGATKAEYISDIRSIVPDDFLLIPGIGEQGGDLSQVCKYGINSDIGLLINSSRGILYSDRTKNFAASARAKALNLSFQMGEQIKISLYK